MYLVIIDYKKYKNLKSHVGDVKRFTFYLEDQ